MTSSNLGTEHHLPTSDAPGRTFSRNTEEIPAPAAEDYPLRVLTDMSTGVLVIDGKGNIVYLNPPASSMLELTSAIPSDVNVFSILSQNQENDAFNDYILKAIQSRESTHTGVVSYTTPSGRKYVFHISSSYLKTSDQHKHAGAEIVLTFTDETKAAELQVKYTDSSRCFMIGIASVCIWTLIYALWEFLGRPVSVDFLTHGTEVMGLIIMLLIFQLTSFTTRELGITMENPGKTLRTALLISAICFAFLSLVKVIGQAMNPTLFRPGEPFVDFRLFTWRQLSYIMTAFIQELIARSILQNNIRRIMVGKHTAFKAVVLSALIFSTLHIQHGFFFMLGAFVLGSLEGILYEKQQNIFGVWIVHWFFGVAGTLLGLVVINH